MSHDGGKTGLDEDPLSQLNDYFKQAAEKGNTVSWDYLNEKLGIGAPPGTPPVATSFRPTEQPQFEPSLRRLKVVLATPIDGVTAQGMLVIYCGDFQDDPPPQGSTYRIYLGVVVAGKITFDDIPIANHINDAVFGLNGIQLLVTTHNMTAAECTCFYTWDTGYPPTNELADTDYSKSPLPPLTGIYSRLTVKTDAYIAAADIPLMIQFGDPTPPPAMQGADRAPKPSATINTRIGPITFLRIFGVYDDEDSDKTNIGIGVDLSIELGPFTVTLQELTASFPLKGGDAFGKASPFKLKGVEVSSELAGVSIGGGLYVDSLDPINLWGELTANISQSFGFAVMAAYAYANNEPSLFGFAFGKVPLGWPPILEISGLAGGFGYNRDLIIPPVEQLYNFPFIQAAMSFANPSAIEYKNPFPTDPTSPTALINTLEALGTTIAPPVDGKYWGTLGLAFTACKVATGFVLLSVLAGQKTVISVVGELQVALPTKAPAEEIGDPLVFIDAFLRLVIDISAGEIDVDFYISHNSYLLESRAKLTGGAAIRVWYKGDHHGEWIVTAGGYAPGLDMSPYPYYPVVPRLGFSLALGNGIQVQGKMYLTVTPSLLMFGLAFQVSGKWGPVELWAIIGFDTLVDWHPTHYDVHVVISFGASFKIKVWFVHITVTVHLGASVHLWGPSLAGDAHLDLSICSVSWHIGDNSDQSLPSPLTWQEFKDKYLTAPNPDPEFGLTDPQSKVVSSIQVESDRTTVLTRKHGTDSAWIVEPETAVIYTRSEIPSDSWSATLLGKFQSSTGGLNTDFGVFPCRYADDQVTVTHTVTITGDDAATFTIVPRIETLPGALWCGEDKLSPIGPLSVVKDLLVGLEIRPVHQAADVTLPADLDTLLETHLTLDLVYIEPSTDHSGGFTGDTVSGTIQSAIATSNRSKLFAALANYQTRGEDDMPALTPDVSGFAKGPDGDLFINLPRLRLLGEDRA